MEWLLTTANWFGSALCHQWDSHSFIIDGVPLCLCARCTGMYLGAVLTLACLALRTREMVRMPRAPYLMAFLVFFVLWAGDGVNSYLTTVRGAPFLYQPQNLIRVVTGTLMGIVLGTLIFIILNSLLKPIPANRIISPLFTRAREFLILLALAAIVVVFILSQWDWLLYPLTALMLFAMLAVNTSMWLAITSSLSTNPTQPTVLRRNLLLAFGITFLLLNAIALARLYSGISFEPLI